MGGRTVRMMIVSGWVAIDVVDRFCYLLKSVGVDRLRFLFCRAAATAFTSEFWVALLPINTVVPSLPVLLLPLGCCCGCRKKKQISFGCYFFFLSINLHIVAFIILLEITCCWLVWLLLNLIFCCRCCWTCDCFCKCNCAVNTIELLLLMTPAIFVPVGFDATVVSKSRRGSKSIEYFVENVILLFLQFWFRKFFFFFVKSRKALSLTTSFENHSISACDSNWILVKRDQMKRKKVICVQLVLVIGVVIFICCAFGAATMFRCDVMRPRAVNCFALIGDVAIVGTLRGRCCCCVCIVVPKFTLTPVMAGLMLPVERKCCWFSDFTFDAATNWAEMSKQQKKIKSQSILNAECWVCDSHRLVTTA